MALETEDSSAALPPGLHSGGPWLVSRASQRLERGRSGGGGRESRVLRAEPDGHWRHNGTGNGNGKMHGQEHDRGPEEHWKTMKSHQMCVRSPFTYHHRENSCPRRRRPVSAHGTQQRPSVLAEPARGPSSTPQKKQEGCSWVTLRHTLSPEPPHVTQPGSEMGPSRDTLGLSGPQGSESPVLGLQPWQERGHGSGWAAPTDCRGDCHRQFSRSQHG